MIGRFLFGLAILPFLTSIASAGQRLSDQQMDKVIAGFAAPASTCGTGSACAVIISLNCSCTNLPPVNAFQPPPLPSCCTLLIQNIFAFGSSF
jgi:hypothetical protein